jgi:signal transduction histidine kinase
MSFQLEFHPLIIPFLIAAVIALWLALYARQIKGSDTARTFTWYALAIFWWEFTSVLEMASVHVDAKQFWTSLKYIGATGGPVLALVLALRATRQTQLLSNRWFLYIIWGWAVSTTLVIFTNPFHHWYWKSYFITPGVLEVLNEKNWWFGIYAAGMYLFILTSTIVYFVYLRKATGIYRTQAFWLAAGGFIPLFFRIIFDFTGITVIANADQVVFFIFFSVIFYAIAIFKYNAVKLVPVAHDQVVKQLRTAVIVTDNAHRVLDINPFGQQMFDVPLRNALGLTLTDITQWNPNELLDNQEKWIEVNGHKHCFQIQVARILENSGNKAGYSYLLYDITKLKETESKLEAANIQRQRMTADIAHDLRTPIQVLGGYLEAMSDGVLDPTEKRFKTMSREMEYLGSLVTDFLTISKADSGELTLNVYPTSMNELLERIHSNFLLQATQQNKTFRVTKLGTDVTVNIDADRMMQVLSNFIRNALQHTVENDDIQLGAYLNTQTIRLFVTDSGKGLSQSNLSKVFDRLFRVDSSREQESGSHGLGLAICRSLVEAHGGETGVESDGEGHGSTFWVSLPLKPAR